MANEINAVIFDMDGVIFDTESVWRDGFYLANKKFGVSLAEDYRNSICGRTEPSIRSELRELMPTLDTDAYRDCIVNYVRNEMKCGRFKVKPEFDTLISYLKKDSFKIALATSNTKERAMSMFDCKGYNAEELFDAMVFGDETGHKSKPDPYIFYKAAEKLALPPDECVVVEDSINGIKAAVDGGFVPVMAVDLIEPDEYCTKNTKKIVQSLGEVIGFLQKM